MKTVKEYLLNLAPGDGFLILDLMKVLDSNSLAEECQILENLMSVEGSVFFYLGSGMYKRMYTTRDPFIKRIREAYRHLQGLR